MGQNGVTGPHTMGSQPLSLPLRPSCGSTSWESHGRTVALGLLRTEHFRPPPPPTRGCFFMGLGRPLGTTPRPSGEAVRSPNCREGQGHGRGAPPEGTRPGGRSLLSGLVPLHPLLACFPVCSLKHLLHVASPKPLSPVSVLPLGFACLSFLSPSPEMVVFPGPYVWFFTWAILSPEYK